MWHFNEGSLGLVQGCERMCLFSHVEVKMHTTPSLINNSAAEV